MIIAKRFYLFLGAAFLMFPGHSFANAMGVVWKWKKSGHELYAPAFHPASEKIALVVKLNWPDGHDAESYPDSYFSALETRKKADPRFADPTVIVLENRGKMETRIDWGWDPAFSANGSLLAYAFQKNPLTGFRVLAKTMEGNCIKVSLNGGAGTEAVRPGSGYFSRPRFSSDGLRLAFNQNDAVNGAYGGMIGWGEVPLKFDRFPFINPVLSERDENYKEVQAYFQNPPNMTSNMGDLMARTKKMRAALDKVPKEPSRTINVGNGDGRHFLSISEGGIDLTGKDGKRIEHLPIEGKIRELVWSPDSKRFAVITSIYRSDDVFDHDELYLIEVKY